MQTGVKYVIVGEGNNDLLIGGLISSPAETVIVAHMIHTRRPMAVLDLDRLLRDRPIPHGSCRRMTTAITCIRTMAIDLSLFRDDDEN